MPEPTATVTIVCRPDEDHVLIPVAHVLLQRGGQPSNAGWKLSQFIDLIIADSSRSAATDLAAVAARNAARMVAFFESSGFLPCQSTSQFYAADFAYMLLASQDKGVILWTIEVTESEEGRQLFLGSPAEFQQFIKEGEGIQ